MDDRDVIRTALRVDVYAQEWQRLNKGNVAKPREVMPYVIEKGVFEEDVREGLPQREIPRRLDE
jgi:hypothetical protein